MARSMKYLLLLRLVFTYFYPLEKAHYNIVDFGAKPGGKIDSTNSFLSAWALVCGSTDPATIYVPAGRFLLNTITFKGPCNNTGIEIVIDGTIVAPSNYGKIGKEAHWIAFDDVDGVSIFGGTIDGRGAALWTCKAARRNCPHGPNSLSISGAKNFLIDGLNSINSKLFHITVYRSEGVTIRGVSLTAPENSPNTDGIHVQLSKHVEITDSTMSTGDDCISIGPGSTDLWIEGIVCGPGHGISIGSLGHGLDEPGVQNVTVKSVVLSGTQNGLRIKTWGSPSNGFVRGVSFQRAIMRNVQKPIVIDQNYCPGIQGCPHQNSGVNISQVSYRDIIGTSATSVAVKFNCSASEPCSDIGLQDVVLTYRNQPGQSYCNHARGTASGWIYPPSCL